MEGVMTDPDSDPRDGAPSTPQGSLRLAELAAHAHPADISDWSKHKLMEDWEKAGGYIRAAEQMDGIKHQAECAEKIVKKLGTGLIRYKDKLYMVTISKRGVVYLREQVARKKHGE